MPRVSGHMWWIDWSLPVGVSDPEGVRRGRLAGGVSVLATFLTLLASLYATATYGALHVVPVTLLSMALSCAGALILQKRAGVGASAIALTVVLVGGELVIAAAMGGIHSPQLVFFPAIIVISAFLGGARVGALCALLIECGIVGFYVLDARGHTFPLQHDANPELTTLVAHTLVLATIAGGVALFELSRKRAYAQIATAEANLAAVLGNTTDAIWSVDRRLQLITANDEFRQRFASDCRAVAWQAHYLRALDGARCTIEVVESLQGEMADLEVAFNPIRRRGELTGVAVFARDISERKHQARKLEITRRELIAVSRLAGMAEVATDVLHNVGNALNSATVSTGVARRHLGEMRVGRVAQLAEVVAKLDRSALPAEQRRVIDHVGEYLKGLGGHLVDQQREALAELGHLGRHVERVAETIARQRAKARLIKIEEPVRADELVAAAIELTLAITARKVAPTVRLNDCDQALRLDRYKVTQILSHLLVNAVESVERGGIADHRIEVTATRTGEWLELEIRDNGAGIATDDVPRIFTQGFSTKPSGVGFSLHWSSLAASELGGRLTFASEGPGRGAAFRLELPTS